MGSAEKGSGLDGYCAAIGDAESCEHRDLLKVVAYAEPQKPWNRLRSAVRTVGGFKSEGAKSASRRAVIFLVTIVLAANLATSVSQELLNKSDRGCADLVLLGQYLYAIAQGLTSGQVGNFVFGRQIPISYHAVFLMLSGFKNFSFSYAFNLGLPMPVNLVLKNLSLAVGMGLGWLVQHKKYTAIQVVGVCSMTVGVVVATFASKPASKRVGVETDVDPSVFVIGSIIVFAGVLSQSLLFIAQESCFKKHGKHFQEALFYQHLIGLPFFCAKGSSILLHAKNWTSKWGQVPLPTPLNIALPHMWLLLLLNISTQHAVKQCSLKLSSLVGSFSRTFVMTFGRFLCLLVSSVVLNSPPLPPPSMWMGSLLVFVGTVVFLSSSEVSHAAKRKAQ